MYSLSHFISVSGARSELKFLSYFSQMNISMPFEPLDAYESLQLLLPPFSLKLSKSDLNGFIIDGFVSRRFIVRGRFKDFGHTRAMRSPEDMTVKSFLSDTIPRVSANPLYKGDAIGCKDPSILWGMQSSNAK